MTDTSIETYSGLFMDLANPDASMVRTEDVIWVLPRSPRYTAHTRGRPYSVGQHVVVVAKLIGRLSDPLEKDLRASYTLFSGKEPPSIITPFDMLGGLLHDASEAYLVDLPTPLKRVKGMAEVYYVLEAKMMEAIYAHFKLPPVTDDQKVLIKWADAYALTVETYHLMHTKGENWTCLLPLSTAELAVFEQPKTERQARADLTRMLKQLLKHANR